MNNKFIQVLIGITPEPGDAEDYATCSAHVRENSAKLLALVSPAS